jgi:hypothetical protein
MKRSAMGEADGDLRFHDIRDQGNIAMTDASVAADETNRLMIAQRPGWR